MRTDIPNSQLDDTIAYSLDSQAAVTSAQKSRAWQRLHEQAAQQVILAPYAVPPQVPTTPSFSDWGRRMLGLLITDETMYQRAAVRRDHLYRLAYASTPNRSHAVIRFHMTDILRYGLL